MGRRESVLDYYYELYNDEMEARWLAGGASDLLCDMARNIMHGFVTSVLIDTDMAKRIRVNAWLDGMIVEEQPDGTLRVVEPFDPSTLGEEFEDMGPVPDWWGTGTDTNYQGEGAGGLGIGDQIQV